MTTVIAILLLAVFALMAALMFLERLSTLLALPIMAIAFLIVAVAADLVQPAIVSAPREVKHMDDFGRTQIELTTVDGPSRFAQWRELRRTEAQLLRQRATQLDASLAALRAIAPTADADAIAQIAADLSSTEQIARGTARQALEAHPNVFAKPPHHSGPRARFDERWATLSITPVLAALAPIEGETDDARRQRRLTALDAASAVARDFRVPGNSLAADAATYAMEYFVLVIRGGSLTLYATILATIFGGMFAVYVKNLRVAERLVYWTAEFAGERPLIIAIAVLIVTAVIFTSVGGLGTVIMLGTIVLPILRSVGITPVVGAGTFLIGIAMGGTLHPVSRRLWIDFYGIPGPQLDRLLWFMVAVYAAVGLAWSIWGTRRGLLSSFSATATAVPAPSVHREVPAVLMLSPLIPVALVYFGGIEEITAFTLSIAYMFACVAARPGAVRVLVRSLIEGAQTVMPPALLMVGIGILVTSLSTPPVQGYLRPLLVSAAPDSLLGYVLLFGLGAPLALYRGPLNVWGMGLAVSATLLATTTLPPAAILGAILAAGMIQGVCDPTNTANVWVAGYQGISPNQILRHTLIPIWLTAIVSVAAFGIWYV